ncbi:hypothetical protein [Humisphaera borealis]|uniref:HEAT repeat domain-containing protein n=1 Tax=Humisphaera borealis TaxID=2807512 RepID=A0A7M2WV03_9BACT|nr:hypothetical protein [Humisphaera borealis]QOV89253.1 hypothetical protein IPV69_24090 [Humisphaera borealis]
MKHFVAHYRPARWLRLSVLALASLVVVPSGLVAQTTPATKPVIKRGGPTPPPSVRGTPNLTAPQVAEIKRWVSTEAAAMTAGDPAVLASARGNIIGAAAIPVPGNTKAPSTPASPAYQTAYATSLEAELLKQLASKDARIRLNAAVTLAKVAASMNQGTTLLASTEKAIGDSSEAVSMWGVRAAKDVYPNLLGINQPGATKLSTAVIGAVKAHPTSAAIAEDAYATLAGTNVTGNAQRAGAGLDAIIALIQARAQLYSKVDPANLPEQDPNFPARPELDAPVVTYLAISGWRAMTPAQKAKAGRAIYDQTNELIRIGPLLPPGGPGIVQTRLNDLMKELKNMSGALQVILTAEKSTAGSTAARTLNGMATNQPAQPLMIAELAKVEAEMIKVKILESPATPPAGAATGTPAALNK